jgi:hypothetical protein
MVSLRGFIVGHHRSRVRFMAQMSASKDSGFSPSIRNRIRITFDANKAFHFDADPERLPKMMRIQIRLFTLMRIRIIFDADPDPAFHFDADPDRPPKIIAIRNRSTGLITRCWV